MTRVVHSPRRLASAILRRVERNGVQMKDEQDEREDEQEGRVPLDISRTHLIGLKSACPPLS